MTNLTTSYQLVGQAELGKVYNSNKAYIRIYAKYNSQSISNNSTNVSLQARVYSESTWYSGKTTTYRITGSGSIDSGSISYTTSASDMYPKNAERTLGTVTKDISHNADGTRTIHAEANFYSSPWGFNATAESGTNLVLPTIPRQANILTAQDFNDEENPTITYENKAGDSVSSLKACISLTGSKDDVPYRDINKTGTLSYTFNLTEDERNVLRKATTTNSRTVIFYVRTEIGSNTFYSTLSKTFKIINGNPVFDDFVFEDVNEQTLNLTGDNQSVIAGYSDVKVTIPVSSKATATKQATMNKYRFNSIDANYSDTADVSITSNKVTNGDFTVYAIDSRGNSKPVTKNATNVINYTPLQKGNIIANRQNGVSPITTLKFSGKWWNGIFGQREIINSGTESGNLRNIRPGEDLSGKTIYFRFSEEPNLHIQIEKVAPQTILQTEDGTIIHSAVEEDENYSYAFIYFNDDYVLRKRIDNASGSTISKRVMPSNCGAITYLNQDAIGYEQIYVAEETITYEHVNNTIKARYRYSVAGEENYIDGETPIELIVDGGNYSFEGLIAGDLGAEGFDINNAYNIQVIIDDELSQVVFTANLGSGTPHIAYAKNGISIMGKYDDEKGGLLQVGSIPIIESGNNENGNWTKWADGTMMCIKHVTGVTPVNRAWGSLYESSNVPLGDYSQPFIEIPIVSATISIPYGESGNGLFIEWIKDKSKTSYGSAIFVRPNESDGATYQVDLTAKGRWK